MLTTQLLDNLEASRQQATSVFQMNEKVLEERGTAEASSEQPKPK